MDGKTERAREGDDRELVLRFLAGETGAFDPLVLRHQDRVMNICYRILGDYEEARDCAQETFIKVYRSLKSFKGKSVFSTWLYRIAVNTCKNRLSSSAYRRRKKMLTLGAAGNGRDDPRRVDPPNGSPTPPERAENREVERLVQTAIDGLDADHKTVVVLRDIEGLSYEEVSRATGFPVGTVKSKLARAREKLKSKLRGNV